jgi:hypothetical protein
VRNPFGGGFSDRAEWQFKTCQKSDGSLYGTSDANQCRVGTETAKQEKDEKIKKLLEGSYGDYEASYGVVREKILNDSAAAQTARALSDDYANMSVGDIRTATAGEQVTLVLNKMDAVRKVNPELADKIGTNSHFFEAMKWDMVNDRKLVSEGSLDEAWKGTDLTANANATFGSKKYGQSKVAVDEHVIPSHALKERLYASTDRTQRGVTTQIINNSRISLTSAKEDNKIEANGFKSTMPDSSKPMSRYEKTEIKTFVLKESITKGNTAAKITKSATKAKEKGMSKEEWIQSIVDGMDDM